MAARPDRAWKTGSTKHEGFPLLLRTPSGLEYDALSKKSPSLLIVEHLLSKVQPSGLPEPEYNSSLEDLDSHLINLYEQAARGVTVLVETFGGKRIYYSYVTNDVDLESEKILTGSRFPGHTLTWNLRNDPEWGFIRRYSKAYGF